MKTLFLIAIVGALAAWAGAFFELWTIPRLEELPTISDYATRSQSLEERAEHELGGSPEKPAP